MKGINTAPLLSRHDHLAVETAVVLDKSILETVGDLLPGTLIGKLASGKYRAYAEAETSAATDNASDEISLDIASKNFKHFRVGDVIEGVDETALGTILAIDSVTGTITLTANAASDAYEGGVRVLAANLSVTKADARILKDFVEYDERIGLDYPATGYFEGFFNEDVTSLTASTITGLGITRPSTNELRLK